jgi:hypothetical protein
LQRRFEGLHMSIVSCYYVHSLSILFGKCLIPGNCNQTELTESFSFIPFYFIWAYVIRSLLSLHYFIGLRVHMLRIQGLICRKLLVTTMFLLWSLRIYLVLLIVPTNSVCTVHFTVRSLMMVSFWACVDIAISVSFVFSLMWYWYRSICKPNFLIAIDDFNDHCCVMCAHQSQFTALINEVFQNTTLCFGGKSWSTV